MRRTASAACASRASAASAGSPASILQDPHRFALNYTRMMMGGTLFMGAAPKRVLIVGLGGGSIPTALRELLPDAQIDVVEIDPAVTRVARQVLRLQGWAEDEGVRGGWPRLREARAARGHEVRRHPARCLRPRVHSRAPADAGVPGRSEVAADAAAACWSATPFRRASSTTTNRPPTPPCSASSST